MGHKTRWADGNRSGRLFIHENRRRRQRRRSDQQYQSSQCANWDLNQTTQTWGWKIPSLLCPRSSRSLGTFKVQKRLVLVAWFSAPNLPVSPAVAAAAHRLPSRDGRDLRISKTLWLCAILRDLDDVVFTGNELVFLWWDDREVFWGQPWSALQGRQVKSILWLWWKYV